MESIVYLVKYRNEEGSGQIYVYATSAAHAECIAKEPLLDDMAEGRTLWFEITSVELATR